MASNTSISPSHSILHQKRIKTFFSKANETNYSMQIRLLFFQVSCFLDPESSESPLQQSFLTADSEITPAKCQTSPFKKRLIQRTSLFFWPCHQVDWNRYMRARQSLNGGTSVTLIKRAIEWCWKGERWGALLLKTWLTRVWLQIADPSHHAAIPMNDGGQNILL